MEFVILVMYNNRGWIRILEATIAVLIVSSVLLVVYSNQSDSGVSAEDYFYDLQNQILSDISFRSDLRLAVLNVGDEEDNDVNYQKLNNFVESEIPEFVGFYLAVCELTSETDYCKLSGDAVKETLEKDVFVESKTISSDLGSGGDAIYSPREVRLYMWEM